jgi:hypothetical protein
MPPFTIIQSNENRLPQFTRLNIINLNWSVLNSTNGFKAILNSLNNRGHMQLPASNALPIHVLAACFNNTVATYKYYWLLSIIQEVENGNHTIPKTNLFARMISNAWFTVNYFHVSFGKQDLIERATEAVKTIENISIEEKQTKVFNKLASSKNKNTISQLWHFDRNVPHWFLSPWFPRKERAGIYLASKSFSEKSLYALYDDKIEINPEWIEYLNVNAKLLKDFCYWNLTLFLQAKNPNVPDIPNKLIKPAERNSLTRQKTNFWNLVVNQLGAVDCIYTGKRLEIGRFDLDHFVPFNFVSHDLIWNLIPIQPDYNSIKSDKLPRLDKHFDKFFQLQKSAVDIVKSITPNNKFLEDYLTIFPDLHSSFTKQNFRDRIQPLITIASNNGFEFLV